MVLLHVLFPILSSRRPLLYVLQRYPCLAPYSGTLTTLSTSVWWKKAGYYAFSLCRRELFDSISASIVPLLVRCYETSVPAGPYADLPSSWQRVCLSQGLLACENRDRLDGFVV